LIAVRVPQWCQLQRRHMRSRRGRVGNRWQQP